jgi:transcriptional regulator with XRE-family HTH domain
MKATEILINRIQIKLTRKELAEKVGVSHRTVESWELGARNPSRQSIILLNQVFGISNKPKEYEMVFDECLNKWVKK